MTDRTTRDEIVEQLRGHADGLDAGDLKPWEAAAETRGLAREIEVSRPELARTDGGTSAVGRVRAFGAAGIELTERAMANTLYVLTAALWMGAGAVSASDLSVGLTCMLGGVVTLGAANRLKGWSA